MVKGGATKVASATANGGLGGAGGTTGCVGDAGGVFAGGSGAGNLGNGGAGGGGGGAGDANPGATATTNAGANGGVAGGGKGGTGPTGTNTGNSGGVPNATGGAGGGGSGGRVQGNGSRAGGAGGLGQIVLTYTIPPSYKANNTDNLNLASSWTAFVPSGSLAVWDSTVTGANTTSLGADLTFSGIQILNPGGPVTINAGNTLTLGSEAIDIDLGTATRDLTLNCNLAMAAANVWDVASGRTLTLGGNVSGAFAVTKQGLGTAILQGNNTWTGSTTVSAGTVKLGASEVIPNGTGTGNVALTGTLDLNGNNETINGLSGAGVVENTAAGTASTLTAGGNNQTSSFSGTLQNSGSSATLGLTKAGTGTLTLTGANSHTGLTTINAGALNIQNATALGSSAAATVVNGGASGGTGNARLELQGGITVTGENATLSGVGNFTGALTSASSTNEWAGNVTIGASGTRLGASAGATLKVSGVIDSGANPYGLVIRTENLTGSVILSAANTYLGNSQVLIGKLQLDGGDNRLPVGTFLQLGSSGTNPSAEFDLNGKNQEVAGIALTGSAVPAQNSVNNSSLTTLSTLTVNTASSPSSFAGILAGNLALTKTGADTLTLAGANTHTGATNVDAGTLLLSTAGSGVSDVSVNPGASAGASVAAADGQFVSTGDLTLDNGSTLLIDFGTTTPSSSVAPLKVDNFNVGTGLGLFLKGLNLGGFTVSQSYPLVTWTTSGPADGSAFTVLLNPRIQGNLSVSGNTLLFTVTANTAGSPISWNTSNGTWDAATSNWVDGNLSATTYFDVVDSVLFGDAAGVSGNPVVTLNNVFAPAAVIMNSTARDYTISGGGGIGGNGSLTLDAANTGTLTVATANTSTGATAVNGGTLRLGDGGANGSLGVSAPITIGSGATFAVHQSDTVTQGTDFSSAAISGAGGFAQTGSGTTILNAVNTYSGPTIVSNGTLRAAVNTTGNGMGTSAVAIGSGTVLLVDNTNTTSTAVTIDNAFTGNGLLKLQFAAGTTGRNTNLSNVADFAGAIQLSSLGVTSDKWSAAGLGAVAGSLIIDPGNTVYFGSGSPAFSGGMTLSGTGNNEGRGAIRLGNATLGGNITLAGDATINMDNSAAVLSGDISSGAAGTQTLTLGATGSTGGRLNGVIGGGAGTLNLATAVGGTYTLANANTYTGATDINSGVLQLGNVNALGGDNPGVNATSGITMATGTTLRSTIGGVNVSAPITGSGTVSIGAPTNNPGSQTWHEFILNGAIGGTTNVTFTSTVGSNVISTVRLNAPGTYSGSTLIDTSGASTTTQIVVRLGTNDALPTGTVVTIDGRGGEGSGRVAEINMNGFSQTLAGLTNTARSLRTQRIVNPANAAAATLTISGASDTTFSGNLGSNSQNFSLNASASNAANGNNFGLIKNGAGTFTLSGSNTFSGATKVLGGVLRLGHANALGQSPLDTLNSVAGDSANGLQTTVTTLTLGGLTGDKDLASVFTTTSGGYVGVTALTLNPVSGASPGYSGIIADGAAGMSLTKSGAGTQTLAGANVYTGATNVNAGTLALGASNVIPDGSAVSIGAATLDAATFTDSVGTLDPTAAATINLGTGAALAFANSNAIDWTNGTLTITGTFVSGQSLRFGNNDAGLTDTQLGLISAAGFTNFDLDADGFLIASEIAGYADWALTNAPTTGNDPNADEDGDGVANGVEYVVGGTIAANDADKLPRVSTSGADMVISFDRDQASIDGTTLVEIVAGTDLVNWPDVYSVPPGAAAANPGVTVIKDTSPGFDTVTLRVARTPHAAKFARMKVTIP